MSMPGGPAPGDLVYLFCLADKIPERVTGCGGKDLSCFFNKGFYAVTAGVSGADFRGEDLRRNLNDLKWVEEKVRFHERVVEKMMASSTVIPFQFGTVFETEESLMKMLSEHVDAFTEMFKKLEGKREWGIKIFCDRKTFARSIEEDGHRGVTEKEMEILSPGRAFLHNKRRDRLMAERVDAKIEGAGREIYEALAGFGAEVRIGGVFPAEATGREGDMILNAAFLVDNFRAGDFIGEVELLKDKYPGLEIECTGPWPPYNFCALKEHEPADRK
ncbi:MAG: GvpL/GvpF family gas vesicle protein [Nitrospiraceae bacterium]|nr:GvpL/GvpF family gas vesicle protein [Nitrospiraceae bacterium]